MKMFIGGKACDSSDGKNIEVINPATGEAVDTVPSATRSDIDKAIDIAVKGQKDWDVNYPLHARMEIMNKFYALVEKHREKISEVLCRESGRPITEAYDDFNMIFKQIRGFCAAAQCLLGGTTIPIGSEVGKELDFDITIREPLGVLVGIVPFNDPLNLWSKKMIPALLCGNSLIIKAPTADPLNLLMCTELLYEAGVPGSACQIVTGFGGELGNWLTTDKRIAGVTFTGSTEVGKEIACNLAPGLKFQSMELGGNAPFIVCDDADIDLAVDEAVLIRAVPRNGQACNSSKRFFLPVSQKDEFIEKLVCKLSSFKIGDPLDPKTQIGTLISERAAKEVEAQVNLTLSQGARLVCGNVRNGAWYTPTVLEGVKKGMDISHNMEVFGPVFPIIAYDDLEDAISLANDTDYGLGSAVFTRDYVLAMKIARRIEAGTVVINGHSSYRNMRTAFGGYKHSGFGREGQFASMMAMTQEKNIVFKYLFR
jgi:succinate-semialdehyde dehydrogenase/glutarate-semialdehyde dehydrogenase